MTLRRHSGSWRRAPQALLGTILAILLVGWPLPAQAHIRAVASWPAVGEVVTTAPDRVTVAFTGEGLSDVRVAVVGPNGESMAAGDPVRVGQFVTQALEASDVTGTYTASFYVISDDLHTINGSLEFVVDPDGVATGNPAGPPPDLGLDDGEDTVTIEASDDVEEASDKAEPGAGPTLLLTGLAGVVLLALVIRVARRRTRA